MKHPLIGYAVLLASFALLVPGCTSAEALCEKHCEKGAKCEEDEPGFEDLSDCKRSCRDLAEETQDQCQEEMGGWSDCMRDRYTCERGREVACRSARDDLNRCLNAQN